MDIGSRIRAKRKALNLSQEALARQADISLNTINQIERGVIADPRYSTLTGVAHALGVTVTELLGDTQAPLGQAPSPPERSGEERRAREQTLVLFLNALAGRFEEYLAGIKRGVYAPGEPRHTDLLTAYEYVDWSVDDSKELRGVLSPEFTAARERLWRAHRNLGQTHVDYRDPGTTQADADLRTARRPRPQEDRDHEEGAG